MRGSKRGGEERSKKNIFMGFTNHAQRYFVFNFCKRKGNCKNFDFENSTVK